MTLFNGIDYGVLSDALGNPTVDLSKHSGQIRHWSKVRFKGSRKNRYKDAANVPGWKSEPDYIALKGEIAFSHWAQSVGSPETTFRVSEEARTWSDQTTFGPYTVQVKSTTHIPPTLHVADNNRLSAKLVVLVSIRDADICRLQSWTMDPEIIRRASYRKETLDYSVLNTDFNELAELLKLYVND